MSWLHLCQLLWMILSNVRALFVVGRMRIVILTTMTTITITMTRNDVVAGCLAARCLICCFYVHIYIFFKIYIFSICCYSYCRRCCYCCYHSCCNRKHFTKEFTFLGGITLMEFLQNIKIFQANGTGRTGGKSKLWKIRQRGDISSRKIEGLS